jgi:hypothetical protein
MFEVKLIVIFSTEYGLEGEGLELVAIAIVELVLELHPVKPEGMQESRQPFHHQKDANCQNCREG